MLLIITGVGFLIHIYSVGYMAHEDGYWRFFSYLNLFLFFMLILVLAENYLLMFVGWEGVGLASYLLIGFYLDKKSAADAGRKAFVVNRIGDFGFLLGMFLLLSQFGTLSFAKSATASPPSRPCKAACSPPSPSACSSEPAENPRRSRSTSGSPTRWKAPPPSPRSSMPPPWSPPAST
jgi:NADH:ubiquinone oxidoreductase subunit 5 (subunit L)/multisubunit Na+/H+ antiporter MnhA subunit